jgi:hypothetical protein
VSVGQVEQKIVTRYTRDQRGVFREGVTKRWSGWCFICAESHFYERRNNAYHWLKGHLATEHPFPSAEVET